LPSIRGPPPEHVRLVESRRNREAEVFSGIACDHKGDADFIGARNILTKTLAAPGTVPGAENVRASIRCFRTDSI